MTKDTWREELYKILSESTMTYSEISLLIEQEIDKAKDEQKREIVESFKANRKFWEDEDHAVGGYVSMKEIKEQINKLK